MECETSKNSNAFINKAVLDDLCTDYRSTVISILDFARCIFVHVRFLQPFSDKINHHFNVWKRFKREVPTNGAIVLSEDFQHVLLVQADFHKECWGFPKGKMMEDETYEKCAIREVLEEIGLNVKKDIDADCFIEFRKRGKTTRLYIVSGIDMETEFGPKTRNEIKEIKWFRLDDLPCHKRDLRPMHTVGIAPQCFSTIIPFVKALRRYVGRKRGYLNYCDMDSVDTVGPHIQIHYGEIDKACEGKTHGTLLVTSSRSRQEVQTETSTYAEAVSLRQHTGAVSGIKCSKSKLNYTPPPRFLKLRMQKKKLSDEDSGFEFNGSDDQCKDDEFSLTSTTSYTSSEDLSEDGFVCDDCTRILQFDGPSDWQPFKFRVKDIVSSLIN